MSTWGASLRIESGQHHQKRARNPAVRHDDGAVLDVIQPRPEPADDLDIAFPARGHEGPPVALTLGIAQRIGRSDFRPGVSFPSAERDFLETIVQPEAGRLETHGTTHQFHRGTGAVKWRGVEVQPFGVEAALRHDATQSAPHRLGLGTTSPVQRNVRLALQPTLPVPIGFAVPDEKESPRREPRREMLRAASIRFAARQRA